MATASRLRESAPTTPVDLPADEALAIARQAIQHARQRNLPGLEALLTLGLPPDVRTPSGDSLLMLAAYHGHHHLERVLLARGADPELRNDRGQSPLAGAAFKGDLAMADLLVEAGADVDQAGPDGRTALMYAAMFDRVEMVEALLRHGARTDLEAADGPTALLCAEAMGAARAANRLQGET
jgi:ankyrin repeat protein